MVDSDNQAGMPLHTTYMTTAILPFLPQTLLILSVLTTHSKNYATVPIAKGHTNIRHTGKVGSIRISSTDAQQAAWHQLHDLLPIGSTSPSLFPSSSLVLWSPCSGAYYVVTDVSWGDAAHTSLSKPDWEPMTDKSISPQSNLVSQPMTLIGMAYRNKGVSL